MKTQKQKIRSSSKKAELVIKFSYECGCPGCLVEERIPICCSRHGDLICINGEKLDLMALDQKVMDRIFEDAGIPGQLDFGRCRQ